MSSPGKVLRVFELNNMLHRLCEPVNSFEFQPCDYTPQAGHLINYLQQGGIGPPYLVPIVYGQDYRGI